MDFKFTVLASTFTTAQCAKAGSMLAIKGPFNAPRHVLKGEEVNDISYIYLKC